MLVDEPSSGFNWIYGKTFLILAMIHFDLGMLLLWYGGVDQLRFIKGTNLQEIPQEHKGPAAGKSKEQERYHLRRLVCDL